MKKLSAIVKFMKAGQKGIRLVRYIAKKAICMRADLGFGKMPLRRNQLPWAAEVLRTFVAGSRASEVRHVVFSLPKDTPRKQAIKLLFEIAADWRATYAPGREWVAAIHAPNHLHLAIANVGSDGRPLKFKPHQVVAMSEMDFTDKVVSAKGIGKKGLPLYSKARKKLVVQDLAALLVTPDKGIRSDVWEQLKKKGLLSGFRSRKDGSVISFEFGGRRIRLATLHRFLAITPGLTNKNTMPIAVIKSDQPLPDSIAAKLLKAGFSNRDLSSLTTNLRSASGLQQLSTEKVKSTIKHHTTPSK